MRSHLVEGRTEGSGDLSTVSARVDDPGRLAALRHLFLLDSPPNRSFDRLTQLAAQLLEAPVSLLTLVDADRQFFLSSAGLPEPLLSARQTPLDFSICKYAVVEGRPLIIGDTRADPVLADNPAVRDMGVAAYAGIPLIVAEGHAVGTLCVLDFVVRDWTHDQLAILAHLTDITMDEMRLHVQDRIARRRRERRGFNRP
jgi:GAF domain-containing protein